MSEPKTPEKVAAGIYEVMRDCSKEEATEYLCECIRARDEQIRQQERTRVAELERELSAMRDHYDTLCAAQADMERTHVSKAWVREVLPHLPIVYRDMLTEMLELEDTDG